TWVPSKDRLSISSRLINSSILVKANRRPNNHYNTTSVMELQIIVLINHNPSTQAKAAKRSRQER
ncbi:hypothetical protein U9M48_043852, partial [Paspalum notatum var. saurae]